MKVLAVAGLLVTLLASPAGAVAATAATVTGTTARDRLTRVGLAVDLGVPEGAGASFVLRPVSFLRVNAGVSTNGLAAGVRGGLALLPFAGGLTPVLAVDFGHYFAGDANKVARLVTGDPSIDLPFLRRFAYDWASVRAGFEVGGRTIRFFANIGVSWVFARVHGLEETLAAGEDGGSTTVTFENDPRLRARTISAGLGVIVYLF